MAAGPSRCRRVAWSGLSCPAVCALLSAYVRVLSQQRRLMTPAAGSRGSMSIDIYLRRRSTGPKVQRRGGAEVGPTVALPAVQSAARPAARRVSRPVVRLVALPAAWRVALPEVRLVARPADRRVARPEVRLGPCITVEAQPLQTRNMSRLARPWYSQRQSVDMAQHPSGRASRGS